MRKILETIRIAIRGEEKNFTSGSINRAIVLLSIPMILEMVMESFFAVADLFFVGRLGKTALTTVGLTESVITIVYSLAFGMAMAATAMVSRRIGENKPDEASKAAVQAIWLGVSVSVVLGVLGFIFAEDVLWLMCKDANVVEYGKGYTKVLFGTNIVITLIFLLNGIFRGAGDANLAMNTLWIANGLNIILDPLFIFGIGPFPELGVMGAAVATTCGRGIGVLYQLYHLIKGTGLIQITRRHLVVIWKTILRLSDVAATGAGQFIIASASWIFLMRIMADFGEAVVAGYIISIRIIMFTILPSWGMANASATLVGQNLGAEQPDRAETSVWRTAFFNMVFLTLLGITLFILSVPVVSIFSTDPEVVEVGVLSLRIICVGYVFFSYGMVIGQAFNGAGDTRTPTLINLISFWIIQIPLAYFFAVTFEWGPAGVFWAIAIAESALALICIFVFRKGKWKTVTI